MAKMSYVEYAHNVHVQLWLCDIGKYATVSFLHVARRYKAEILPIRRKTLSNQSINQSILHVAHTQTKIKH